MKPPARLPSLSPNPVAALAAPRTEPLARGKDGDWRASSHPGGTPEGRGWTGLLPHWGTGGDLATSGEEGFRPLGALSALPHAF